MANIGPVKLAITVTSNSTTSRACVKYTVSFNQQDIAGNRRYRETITLRGEDSPAGPAGDELLFVFVPPRIIVPNGQAVVQRTVCTDVPNSALDEDPGNPQDEVYARVRLTPLDPPFAPAIPPFRDSGVVSI